MPSRIESPKAASESFTNRRSILGRPRTKTGFSLRSSHSRKSNSSASKVILHESHEEKEAHRLQTKADPSMAIVEVEPSVVASDTKPTIAPIRAIQHRDNFGNLITEPDRSNPTRNRWERPLDTIRSFEAAIDGSYSRKSQIRNDLAAMKRSSYYAGSAHPAFEEKIRARPRSYYSPSPTPSGQYNSFEHTGLNNNYYTSRSRNSRSEFYNSHTIYSVPDVQETYELVNSASASGSSLDPSISTGQSSENSSIDRVTPNPQKDLSSDNLSGKGGYDGLLQPQMMYQHNQHNQYTHGQLNGPLQRAPDLEVKSIPRTPIKLGNSTVSRILSTSSRPPNEKRRSWLSRRLSRISRDRDPVALK